MNEIYLIICISTIFCLIILVGFSRFFKQILRLQRVKNFPSYYAVFNLYLDRAYEIIYQDRIFTYSAEGYKLETKEHEEVMKEYVKLVIKMLGSEFHKDLLLLYGNQDTLIFNILDHFNEKYDKDEIRGAALENLSNKEEEEIK